MALDERKFRRLKLAAEAARTERDKAVGELDAAKRQIKEKFDCSSIKEAEKLWTKFNKEAAKLETAYDTAVNDFEKVLEETGVI